MRHVYTHLHISYMSTFVSEFIISFKYQWAPHTSQVLRILVLDPSSHEKKGPDVSAISSNLTIESSGLYPWMLRSCLIFKLESASSKRVPCHFLQENLVQAGLTRTSSEIRSAWLERPSTAIINLLWCYVTSAALAFHEFFSMQLQPSWRQIAQKWRVPFFSKQKKTWLISSWRWKTWNFLQALDS